MARNDRMATPGGVFTPENRQMLILIGVAALAAAGFVLGGQAGWVAAGRPGAQPAWSPLQLAADLRTGRAAWSTASTVVAALPVAVLLLVGVVVQVSRRRGGGRRRLDDVATSLGQGAEINPITTKHAARMAKRFGMDADRHPGLTVGTVVGSGAIATATWEDAWVAIFGPRGGKTTALAIPVILEAPGAVLVTSNKRDIVDATRGPREKSGGVWVFDPQGVATEPATSWWWDPLSYVTDDLKARTLAGHFAAGTREPGSTADAFFEPAGKDLLASFLLAAALAGEPITRVYAWTASGGRGSAFAADILRAHGYPLMADGVQAEYDAPDRQRQGVFGSARKMIACLTLRSVSPWVNRQGPEDRRRQFSPEHFVRAGGTLYSLSREGEGSAGPLVTALTVAVVEAAEALATRSSGGRLKTPLVAVLDEAANVCRWGQLPDIYSHATSRGIILLTILQSYEQGVAVWGKSGMAKLWSAATIRLYGGRTFEPEFLSGLSRLIGERDVVKTSTSTSSSARGGGGSVSRSVQREAILTPADLVALPESRVVLIAAGARPVLVEITPWHRGPHADDVSESLARFDPGRNP